RRGRGAGGQWRRSGLGGNDGRLDLHAVANLLHALDDHLLTRLDALVEDPEAADPGTGLHLPALRLALGVDDHHRELALQLLDSALRDEQRRGTDLCLVAELRIEPGPQHAGRIGEGEIDAERARLRIDGAVDRAGASAIRI